MSEPRRPSPIDHDALVECASLASLRALYEEQGETFETDEAFLEAVQLDWREVAFAKAKEFTEPPDELPAVECQRDGVQFRIYGAYHGLLGGRDPDYKQFLDRCLKGLPHVIFENGIHWGRPRNEYALIPDTEVMGTQGALRMGIYAGLRFPLLVWELLTEVLRVGGAGEGFQAYEYSRVFHAVPPETRRGLDEWPALPSRLQIEYELDRWRRPWARFRDPWAIAPRSIFMAGFALGYAKRRGREQVNLFVGDLHTMEIVRALEGSHDDSPEFRAGETFGSLEGAPRILAYAWAKVSHLGVAALGGSLVLLPALLCVYFALLRIVATNMPR